MTVQTGSQEARPDRRAAQLRTGQAARRSALRWTPEDDNELLTGPGTVADRALRLGRTYYAATLRLSALRKQAQQ